RLDPFAQAAQISLSFRLVIHPFVMGRALRVVRDEGGFGAHVESFFASNNSRPTKYRNPANATNGSSASQSAFGPAKNGLDVVAHLVIRVSTLVNTPAMKAIMMPAIAPPAM